MYDPIPTPIRRVEQTERVCAVHASLIPIPRATKHDPLARTWSHSRRDNAPHPRAHTRTRPRTPRTPGRPKTTDHDRFMLGFLERLTVSTFQFFKTF